MENKFQENRIKQDADEGEPLEDLTNENNNIESFKESLNHGANTLLYNLLHSNYIMLVRDRKAKISRIVYDRKQHRQPVLDRTQLYQLVPPSAEELKYKEMAKCLMSYGARLEPSTKNLLLELDVLDEYFEDIYPSKIALLATVPVDHSKRVRHVLHRPLHESRILPYNNQFLDLFQQSGVEKELLDYLGNGVNNPSALFKGIKNKKSKRKRVTGKNYSKK